LVKSLLKCNDWFAVCVCVGTVSPLITTTLATVVLPLVSRETGVASIPGLWRAPLCDEGLYEPKIKEELIISHVEIFGTCNGGYFGVTSFCCREKCILPLRKIHL
jgi:hypothetical protein